MTDICVKCRRKAQGAPEGYVCSECEKKQEIEEWAEAARDATAGHVLTRANEKASGV